MRSDSTESWRSSPLPGCGGGACIEPRRNATTSGRERRPTTSIPSTSAASAAFALGTITPCSPRAAAAIDTDSAPGVATRAPSSESSPQTAYRSRRTSGSWRCAVSTPTASGRSRPGPCLRTLAGERLTTTRRAGHSNPARSTAGRIRSRASLIAAPGIPVRVSDGRPRPIEASTTTISPRTPVITTPSTRAYMRAPYGCTPTAPCGQNASAKSSTSG